MFYFDSFIFFNGSLGYRAAREGRSKMHEMDGEGRLPAESWVMSRSHLDILLMGKTVMQV